MMKYIKDNRKLDNGCYISEILIDLSLLFWQIYVIDLSKLQKQPLEVIYKKDTHNNFANLCWSLFFNKVVGLKLATLSEKRLQQL